MPFQKGNNFGSTRVNIPNFKGKLNPFHGRHHSEETKKRHSEFMKGKLAGDKHPRWKGGHTPKYWRGQVLKRDNYTCTQCKLFDPEIVEANHIKSKKVYPELSNLVSNGETLCPNCHKRKTVRDAEIKALKSKKATEQWIKQRLNRCDTQL